MQTKLTAKYKHGHQATVTHRHAHRHTWHASHLSLCQASITFPEPGSLLCVLPHRLPAACQHSVTQRNPIKQTTKVMDTRLKEDGWKLRWSPQGTKHTLRRWAKEQCQYLTERGRVGWGVASWGLLWRPREVWMGTVSCPRLFFGMWAFYTVRKHTAVRHNKSSNRAIREALLMVWGAQRNGTLWLPSLIPH